LRGDFRGSRGKGAPLRPASLSLASNIISRPLHLPSYKAKRNRPPCSLGSRLRYWLGPSLQAPICEGRRLSLYPKCLAALLVTTIPTLAPARAREKRITCDICPRRYITSELSRTSLRNLSEESRRRLLRSRADRHAGVFRSISPSVYQQNHG
jgi:hypothetical protein